MSNDTQTNGVTDETIAAAMKVIGDEDVPMTMPFTARSADYLDLDALQAADREVQELNRAAFRKILEAAWKAAPPRPSERPWVVGRCPACNSQSLALTDGSVCCMSLECPNPLAASDEMDRWGES